MPVYVHAPYLINVASANNRIRIPSRKILQQTCDAAGRDQRDRGHRARRPRADDDEARPASSAGSRRLNSSSPTCRCTSRTPRAATTRWPATSTRSPACGITSATAASASASTPATRRGGRGADRRSRAHQAITGRIDLVHCNDSKDGAGSGPTGTRTSAPATSTPNCSSGRDGRRCAGHLRDRRRGPQGRHRLPARTHRLMGFDHISLTERP